MHTPLISVIVPIFNAEKYLARCLDSLIDQTYKNLELILVNDGSSDHSSTICDEYARKDKRIRVIHKQNAGVSEARNSGLNIAKGDYIHFVDADDWLELNSYKELTQIVSQHIDCDIIRFNGYNSAKTVINPIPFRGEYSNEELENIQLAYIGSELFDGIFIMGVPWLYLIKRDLIDHNMIRFDRELSRCEDRLFIINAILLSKKMLFVDNSFYHYDTSNNSLSNKYDIGRWEQEKLYLGKLKSKYSSGKSTDFIQNADYRINNDYLLRVISSINHLFFSINILTFNERYSKTKAILNEVSSIADIRKYCDANNTKNKNKIIINLIKYNQPLLLSIFNTLLLYKHKN